MFYRGFYEVILDLEPKKQLRLFRALCEYGLNGEMVELQDTTLRLLLKSFMPQIDANNKRFVDGSKGGEYGHLGGAPRKDGRKPGSKPLGRTPGSKNKKKKVDTEVEITPLGLEENIPENNGVNNPTAVFEITPKEKDKEKDKEVKEKNIYKKKPSIKSNNKKSQKGKYPDEEELIDFFVENGFKKSAAQKAYVHYALNEDPWHDAHGKKVIYWKTKIRTNWFTIENKAGGGNGTGLLFEQE